MDNCWRCRALYSFTGGNDVDLIRSPALAANAFLTGSLYGTTFDWGTSQNGTVFKVVTNLSFSTLLSFNTTIGDLP